MEEFDYTVSLPGQMLFCQAVPLLPSVALQQNIMGYWWEVQPLLHVRPTFWFAWATLSEQAVSWAAYKICNIVNVCK